ncbi:hypothetical protein [Catenuloplanes japonicus]|uniref:hypothetical protein n=1 Tax=Catenuloplanes japonicus TaxID=33876 RepID=UPI0005246793|nr:hypothetical protein [Catenuloplanes japonicus]
MIHDRTIFRITNIALDDEERPAQITFVANDDAAALLNDYAEYPTTQRVLLGDGFDHQFVLTVAEAADILAGIYGAEGPAWARIRCVLADLFHTFWPDRSEDGYRAESAGKGRPMDRTDPAHDLLRVAQIMRVLGRRDYLPTASDVYHEWGAQHPGDVRAWPKLSERVEKALQQLALADGIYRQEAPIHIHQDELAALLADPNPTTALEAS